MTDVASLPDFDELERDVVAGTIVGAVILGLYAAWIAADIVARWLVFLVVALVVGYVLLTKPTVRSQAVYGGYALAALIVLTPIFVIIPDVLSAGTYGVGATGMIFQIANLLLLVVFLIPAAIVAYAAYRLDGGTGVVERVRQRT